MKKIWWRKAKPKRTMVRSKTFVTLSKSLSHFETTASNQQLLDYLTANMIPWLSRILRKTELLVRCPNLFFLCLFSSSSLCLFSYFSISAFQDSSLLWFSVLLQFGNIDKEERLKTRRPQSSEIISVSNCSTTT